jgi:hypothetical protein
MINELFLLRMVDVLTHETVQRNIPALAVEDVCGCDVFIKFCSMKLPGSLPHELLWRPPETLAKPTPFPGLPGRCRRRRHWPLPPPPTLAAAAADIGGGGGARLTEGGRAEVACLCCASVWRCTASCTCSERSRDGKRRGNTGRAERRQRWPWRRDQSVLL